VARRPAAPEQRRSRGLTIGLGVLRRARGIARSLLMYYGDPAQPRRMARFYARFIGPGDLCFDIGAHVGSRIPAWSRLGARIVAVEPHPTCVRILRRLYGGAPNVELVEAALGASPGEQVMLVCDREPTVSTLSQEWASTMRRRRRSFATVRWDRLVVVRVTTLDALIARYGEPVFCKIDVEGYDLEVLTGLSQPLRALSFEYVPPALDTALACLDRLRQLGPYEFNWSPGESMRLQLPDWVDARQVAALLRSLSDQANPGDVYARLRHEAQGS
jgi:FkbM family methyltransferase